MKLKSEGVYSFCSKTFSATAMSRHLQSCRKRKEIQDKEEKNWKIFLLRAQAGPFFVYFETKASSTLKDVDAFLRRLWLECCSHLSAFTINNVRFEVKTDGVDSMWSDIFGRKQSIKTMSSKLYSVLTPGLKFLHEYDFGSTTELEMTFWISFVYPVVNLQKQSVLNVFTRVPDFSVKNARRNISAARICSFL